MEFGIEKYAMLIKKSGKRQMTEELPNQEKIRTLGEKETYKYLGILEADTIKINEEERKKRKEKIPRKQTTLQKSHQNTSAVPLVRYSGSFLKCTREELQQIDLRTKKLMTMHKG